MDIQYTIQNELRDLNSSLPFEKQQPYTVPDGYFQNLAAAVLAKIKGLENNAGEEIQSLSPLLAAIPRKMPFSVPDNYFEQSFAVISKPDEEGEVPPLFNHIGKGMPYEVPAGYFEALPQQVLAKVTKPTARVISFNTAKWMRYAVAAVLTGAIALGGIAYFTRTSSVDPVKQPHEWVAKKLQNVSTQALDDFIKTTEPLATQLQPLAKNSATNKEVRKLLRDVSTSELDAFLSSVPHENDELSATN